MNNFVSIPIGEGQSALIHFLPKSSRKTIISLHLTERMMIVSPICSGSGVRRNNSELSLPLQLIKIKTENTGQSTFSGFWVEDFLL
jgi:hypothetical protein